MNRFALAIEYNGSGYNGWQIQSHCHSVQHECQKALSVVADFPIKVVCAGRTDSGVHAAEQIIHFDTDVQRQQKAWVLGVNANLPTDIRVLWAKQVSEDFHARFSALQRSYRYVILNRAIAAAYLHKLVTHQYRALDVSRMQQAATYLIGKHDFSSYRAVSCQAHTAVREVFKLAVTRKADLVFIDITANAFLHHMVRNIAGVLMAIGAGDQQPLWAKQVLDYKDRSKGGVTAAADGLYLLRVDYAKQFELPQLSSPIAVW